MQHSVLVKPRIKPISEAAAIGTGKVPPNNQKAEKGLLGIILMENHTLDIATEIIKGPEYFYSSQHQEIYRTILLLRDQGRTIDTITVMEQIQKSGRTTLTGEDLYFLTTLTETVTSSTGAQDYTRIIAEKYMLRKLAEVGNTIGANAHTGEVDVFDLIDYAEKEIMSLNSGPVKGDYKSLGDTIYHRMKTIDNLRHSDRDLTGVRSGFKALDRLTCGWQKPDLIILAARPSVGKTAFALNLALNAATGPDKVGVGFFSMEMSREQLIDRLLSIESRMPLEKISRGKMEDHEFERLGIDGMNPLSKKQIFIDDTPALTIYELRNKARKMKGKNGVGLILIDYLQLMSGSQKGRDDNREQEISKISRDLKGLAKELEIPIIALSQLSRGPEKREVKMPVLSDLRESGAIEQDADIVMFMYRPEYYNVNMNENGDQLNGETHIKFAKHRNGPLDTVKIRANLTIQKFEDMEETKQLSAWKPNHAAQAVLTNHPPPIKDESEPEYKF